MGKAKRKANTNHINCVPVEIDYDKLAEAIAAASEKAKKETTSKAASRELMKFILTPILYVVSISCAVTAVGFFIVSIQNIGSAMFQDPSTFFKFSFSFMLCLFMLALTFLTFLAAREVYVETDRDYIAALFSNVVSFAALVIALVALMREVV